ncbi:MULTISPECIES: hypothetical protein [Providencia]
MSLADIRVKRDDARKRLAEGNDPAEHRNPAVALTVTLKKPSKKANSPLI